MNDIEILANKRKLEDKTQPRPKRQRKEMISKEEYDKELKRAENEIQRLRRVLNYHLKQELMWKKKFEELYKEMN